MSEQGSNVWSKKLYISVVLLGLILVALIIVSVFSVIDKNNAVKRNEELMATVEALETQVMQAAEQQAEADSRLTGAQTDLENTMAEADKKLQTLQDTFDAYKTDAEATLANLQQQYDTDIAASAAALAAAQQEAEQTQTELNAKIDELTNTIEDLATSTVTPLATPAPTASEGESGAAMQTEKPTTTQAVMEVPDVVEVSDGVSLLAAIQPNRTIRLLPGDYNISVDDMLKILQDDQNTQFPYVYYKSNMSGKSLNQGVVIANVDHLTILAEQQQEIYTQKTTDTVLNFEGCSDVTISGILLGHKPERGDACVADVVSTAECRDFVFSNCELYGCGNGGVYIESSSSITFTDSIIRDCTDMAIYIYGGTDISFFNTEMFGIGTTSKYINSLVQITNDSKNVLFSGCSIHDNGNWESVLKTALFLVDDQKELTLMNCDVYNNDYQYNIFSY